MDLKFKKPLKMIALLKCLTAILEKFLVDKTFLCSTLKILLHLLFTMKSGSVAFSCNHFCLVIYGTLHKKLCKNCEHKCRIATSHSNVQ